MAKLSKEQMDALLAQGYISTELYNTAVKGDKVDENAIRMAGKDAVALQKQAEQFGGTGTRQPDTSQATPFVPTGEQAVAPTVNRPLPTPTKTLPEVTIMGEPPKPEQKGLLNQAWDWVTGANDPMYNESGGKLVGANPAGQKIAADVKAKEEQAKKDEQAAPPGSLPTDQQTKPSGGGGGLGGPVAPPKPQFSPEMQAQIDRLENAYGDQKTGFGQSRDVTKQQADETGKLQHSIIADLEARAAVEAKQQKAEQDYMTAEIDRLKTKAEELGSRELDPERAWNRGLFKGNATANKIVAGIGMLFGAAGTRKGGANPAVKVIEDAIDRDIDMQKFDKAAGFRALENQRGLLHQYMQVTDSRRVAEHAAKLDYLQRSALKLEEISTKFKGPEADAQYTIAAAELDKTIAKERIALQHELEKSAKIGAAGGGGASAKSIHEDQRYIAEALEKAGIPGVEASITNAEDALKQNEPMSNLVRGGLGIADKASPLHSALAQGAYGLVGGEGALRTEQALRTLVAQVVKMRSGASATDAERQDLMKQTIGDGSPQAIASGIDALKREVQTRKNNIMTGSAEPGRLEQARRAGQEEQISPTKKPGKPGAAK